MGVPRYDPEVAALLIVVAEQLETSRAMLEFLAGRGVSGTEPAGSHAALDQLQAAVADAQCRLLPAAPGRSTSRPGGIRGRGAGRLR